MTDGQDVGWQPQQGDAEQSRRDQPWQENRYDTGTHRQRISAPQSLPSPLEGTNWFQPGSRQQYPPPDPTPQPPYGPPGEPQDPKHWAARHKVLTGFLAFCGLMLIIGTAAAAGFSSSSSSSRSAAVASGPTVKAPAITASPTVKKAPAATHAVTTAPSTPAPTTPAPPSTQPRTTAAVRKSAPSTPAHTTAAPTPSATPSATPSPTASQPPASCHPLTNAGNCYEPGEFCRKTDHGTSGVAGDGKAIECVNVKNVGWRWEAA